MEQNISDTSKLDHKAEKNNWDDMVPETADHEMRKSKMNFRVRPSTWAHSEAKKEGASSVDRYRTSRAWRRRERRASFDYGLRIFVHTAWDAEYDQGGRVGITGKTWYPIGSYKAPRDRTGQETRSKARSLSVDEDSRPRISKAVKLPNPVVRLKRNRAPKSRTSVDDTSAARDVRKRRRVEMPIAPLPSMSPSSTPVAREGDFRVKEELPTEDQSQPDWGGTTDETSIS